MPWRCVPTGRGSGGRASWSSLGGARPKAGVLDPEGRLWIAKFPSRLDDDDVGA
jgi:serine/threonine-protein kinase HipA